MRPSCDTCRDDPAMIPLHNSATVIHSIRWLRSGDEGDLRLLASGMRDTPAIEQLGLSAEVSVLAFGEWAQEDAVRARLASILGDLIDVTRWEPTGDQYERIYLGGGDD